MQNPKNKFRESPWKKLEEEAQRNKTEVGG